MPYIDLKKIKTENHWTNKLKDKARAVSRYVGQKAKEGIEFVRDNPESAAILLSGAGLLVGGVKKLGRTIDKGHQRKLDKWHKEREIYDHSLGKWLVSNRPMDKKDLSRIRALKSKGLSTYDAMVELKLL